MRRIIPSKADNTITLLDSGIGMTKVSLLGCRVSLVCAGACHSIIRCVDQPCLQLQCSQLPWDTHT